MTRTPAVIALFVLLLAMPGRADVILTATAVNDSLKQMQRLAKDAGANTAARADAQFELATTADKLTTLMNDEVAAHGAQEQRLIDLAVTRAAELGVVIARNPEGKRYFYDNAGFKTYLQLSPRGPHAERARFKVIEGEFFGGAPESAGALEAAAETKRAFLAAYPRSASAPEVHLMLAVDFRDLYLRASEAGQPARQTRFADSTRRQLRALMAAYPESEQAEIARRMLQRFDDLVRKQQR